MTLLKDASGTAGFTFSDVIESSEAVALTVAAPTGVAATDTTAIQAKLTAAGADGATEVHLREGAYSFTNLTFPVTATGTIKLIGQGIGKTTLTCTGTSGYAITFGDGTAQDTQRAILQDFTLVGNADVDGGVKLNSTRFCAVLRVKVQDFTKAGARGLNFLASVANYFAIVEHCQFRNSPIGIELAGVAGVGGNSNYIRNNHFGVHSSYGVLLDIASGNVIEQNEFNGSVTVGIRLQGASTANKIIANGFDGPTTSIVLATSAVTDTHLIANTGLSTLSDAGTRTTRMDSLGTNIQGNLNAHKVGAYAFSIPTDGIGALGDVRVQGNLYSNYSAATQSSLRDGFVEMTEQTDPAAPAANGVRLYAKDVGGKTALIARFPSGAVQQIAIEP